MLEYKRRINAVPGITGDNLRKSFADFDTGGTEWLISFVQYASQHRYINKDYFYEFKKISKTMDILINELEKRAIFRENINLIR